MSSSIPRPPKHFTGQQSKSHGHWCKLSKLSTKFPASESPSNKYPQTSALVRFQAHPPDTLPSILWGSRQPQMHCASKSQLRPICTLHRPFRANSIEALLSCGSRRFGEREVIHLVDNVRSTPRIQILKYAVLLRSS